MSKSLNDIVLFACNQGGHFSQMMALNALFSKFNSVLITDNVRATKDLLPCKDLDDIQILVGESSKRKKIKQNQSGSRISFIFEYIKLMFACNKVWKQYRPKVIISTGSNLAVPLFFIGKINGSKLIYIETRAKVYARSMTGILVRCISDQIFVQWPEMLKLYPNACYCGTLV